MKIVVGVTRICVYDLHFTTSPLHAPALLQPAARILGAPDQYEKLHEKPWNLDIGRLSLSSFDARYRWSHFWRGYQALCATEGSSEEYPRFHIPLDCTLRDITFAAILPPPFGRVSVQVRLLLWPYGWSTRLELSLCGPAGLPALAEASRSLYQDQVIELHSAGAVTAHTLSTMFRAVSEIVQDGLFTKLIGEKRPVSRHSVVAMNPFIAPHDPFTYKPDVDPEHPSLPTADRARLHSILLGRTVPLAEVIERDKSNGIAVTGLHAAGFAVTDFNAGSLLVLHEPAARSGKATNAARCLWRNTTAMLTTTSALTAANRGLKGQSRDWMDQSADWSARMLREIPKYYESPVCRQVYATHGGIRRVVR
jgi:hypothetical protein